jgi:hypothetical protein
MVASVISAVADFSPMHVWQMHGGRRQTLLKDATESRSTIVPTGGANAAIRGFARPSIIA